ncbi:MAG: hypothetical protein COU81_00185 [Candidatus Portnoybacteria bacterium CG10_big_fil_rev_8_21_14_0_10_36_7]|uniref:Radical SAM core domain-containing protein n=1 Tax=Candidatus Portnoybacteria bacterium CG10_big_fil_rev_8_21_14_0_10_36_7 TaxID=1974812 RepID=A0A2M8KF52_9BACT|nr:MAG: hypothetical protein COU81_00185 [Candidatus Portnoybacteria bacterium CG10_big_fil_rev_8_21_14_0_10_36_7]
MKNLFKKILNKLRLEFSYFTGHNFYTLDYVSLITTFRCNFKCRTCDIWKKQNFDELDISQWRKITTKLKTELPTNTFIEISGGEALIQTELIIDLIKNLTNYFETVVLNTNGSIISENIIAKLKSAGLNKIKLSLYSLDSETHNFLRGTDIAYSSAIGAIDTITKSGIDLEVGVLITKQNISQIPELINYFNKFERVSIVIQMLDEIIESLDSKNKSINNLEQNLWPNNDAVNKFFNWLGVHMKNIKNSSANLEAIKNYYLNPKSVLAYRCFSGQRNLVIYPNGDVALCFKRPVIGNLIRENLNYILNKKAISERKAIGQCQKYCRIIGCNFSRGLVEVIKGK